MTHAGVFLVLGTSNRPLRGLRAFGSHLSRIPVPGTDGSATVVHTARPHGTCSAGAGARQKKGQGTEAGDVLGEYQEERNPCEFLSGHESC